MTSNDVTSWKWVTGRIADHAAVFAAGLRAGRSPQTPVPGLDWTVGELGAHVANLPQLYRSLTEGEPIAFPADMVSFNRSVFDARGTTDLEALAALVEADFGDLVEHLLGDDPGRPIRWWGGAVLPARQLAGIVLNEQLVHGFDLARSVGGSTTVAPDDARAAMRGMLPAAVHFVNTETARRCDGATFHVHVRGAEHWTIQVDGESVSVAEGRPPRADFRISADPVAMLLSSMGRIGQIAPALTGKIVGWGRKPWLGARFQNLFATP